MPHASGTKPIAEHYDQALELFTAGLTYAEIGTRIGRTRQAVYQLLARHGGVERSRLVERKATLMLERVRETLRQHLPYAVTANTLVAAAGCTEDVFNVCVARLGIDVEERLMANRTKRRQQMRQTCRRVAAALREARRRRGWRNVDMEQALRAPQSSVSQWSRAITLPRLSFRPRIAALTGRSEEDLFGDFAHQPYIHYDRLGRRNPHR